MIMEKQSLKISIMKKVVGDFIFSNSNTENKEGTQMQNSNEELDGKVNLDEAKNGKISRNN